jgi:hypothetical protein
MPEWYVKICGVQIAYLPNNVMTPPTPHSIRLSATLPAPSATPVGEINIPDPELKKRQYILNHIRILIIRPSIFSFLESQ